MKTSRQLLVIIGLPILCFVIGFFGVKWYLESQGAVADEPEDTTLTGKMPSPVQEASPPIVEEPDESPAEEPTETEVAQEETVEMSEVTLRPLTLYAIQVASFSTAESAAEAVAELVSVGQPATIIRDDYHKVIVACSPQKEVISALIPTVRETYEGAFTLEISLGEKRLTLPASVAGTLERKDEMVKAALVEAGQQFTWSIGIEGSVTIAPVEPIGSLTGEIAEIDKTLTEVANRFDRMRSGSSETAWQLYLDSVAGMSTVQ